MSETNTMLTEGGQANDSAAQQGNVDANSDEQATNTGSSTDGQQADGGAQGDTNADEGKGEGKQDSGNAEGAPESYEPFTLPEGASIDPATNDKLVALAKELGLTQAQAQKIADLGAEQSQQFAKRQQEQFTKANEEWINATRTDKEIGGDKLQETLATAKKALDAFGTPELTELLNGSGFGNHPEVIRLFAKIGKSVSEDGFVRGGTSTGEPKRAADVLYGGMNQKR